MILCKFKHVYVFLNSMKKKIAQVLEKMKRWTARRSVKSPPNSKIPHPVFNILQLCNTRNQRQALGGGTEEGATSKNNVKKMKWWRIVRHVVTLLERTETLSLKPCGNAVICMLLVASQNYFLELLSVGVVEDAVAHYKMMENEQCNVSEKIFNSLKNTNHII